MVQDSRPWYGTVTGDAGPYSDVEWQTMYQHIVGSIGNDGNGGRLLGSDNLDVTRDGLDVVAQSPATTSVNVRPGRAIVQGTFYESTEIVAVAIDSNSSGNSRYDRIVLRKSVAAQTVRIALLKGTPAPSPIPPSLTQNDSTWEISLALILLANGFASISDSVIQPTVAPKNGPPGIFLSAMLNNGSGTRRTGDVVVADTSNDRSTTTTTTADNPNVIGVWVGETDNTLRGRVLTSGIGYVRATTAVTRGQFLGTSTTAGSAKVGGPFPFAQALETTAGAGLVLCYVFASAMPAIRSASQYAKITNTQASGTPGGAFPTSTTWVKLTLNTLVQLTTFATLGSSVIGLPAGSYYVRVVVPTISLGNAKLRLRDTTNGVTLIRGVNAHMTTADPDESSLVLSGVFTLAAAANVELQLYVSSGNASTNSLGYALSSGESEDYALVEIWKRD